VSRGLIEVNPEAGRPEGWLVDSLSALSKSF